MPTPQTPPKGPWPLSLRRAPAPMSALTSSLMNRARTRSSRMTSPVRHRSAGTPTRFPTLSEDEQGPRGEPRGPWHPAAGWTTPVRMPAKSAVFGSPSSSPNPFRAVAARWTVGRMRLECLLFRGIPQVYPRGTSHPLILQRSSRPAGGASASRGTRPWSGARGIPSLRGARTRKRSLPAGRTP